MRAKHFGRAKLTGEQYPRSAPRPWQAYYQRIGATWHLLANPLGAGDGLVSSAAAHELTIQTAMHLARAEAMELGYIHEEDLGFIAVYAERFPGRPKGWTKRQSFQGVRRPWWSRCFGSVPKRLRRVPLPK